MKSVIENSTVNKTECNLANRFIITGFFKKKSRNLIALMASPSLMSYDNKGENVIISAKEKAIMEPQEAVRFLYEVFDASLPRLGPGNNASTVKAMNMLIPDGHPFRTNANSPDLKILDIGCGNGAQTIQLAKHLEGTVTAMGNHRPYLKELMRRARAEAVEGRIRPYEKDMNHHGLGGNSFHVIWAEGSLYVADFRNGLSVCRDLLVTRGLMAVSELCWLRKDSPSECRSFFADEYPPMTDIETNLSHIKNAGYTD